MEIIKAQESHIPEIVSIAIEYEYNQLKLNDKLENGFLVSNYTEDNYLEFISTSDQFYVATDRNVVTGFILAFSRSHLPETDWVGKKMKLREKKPFILVKQVVVAHEHLGKGIATQLYKHLARQNPGILQLAAIVLEPPNQISIEFHEYLGFEKIYETIPSDKIPRGVWGLTTNII